MNKEFAKTLTTALVQFIDRERPEGTMDCSSAECERIESSFKLGDFPSIEQFVKKKLSRLTEVEKCLVEFYNERTCLTCDKDGIYNRHEFEDLLHTWSSKLLALAKKELLKDDELTKKHLDGYCMGREDTLKEMMDFVESHFHGKKTKEFDTSTINIPAWEPPCYHGGPCTNPMRDCINCPGKTTGLGFSTSSGTSTAVLHGNTSTTDGKPHNPSFTD